MSSWFLAGCAEAPPPRLVTQIQIERPEIPGELLVCPAIPLPPEGTAMQSDVAAYIIDLFGAGSECRRKLEAVGGLVNGPRIQFGDGSSRPARRRTRERRERGRRV